MVAPRRRWDSRPVRRSTLLAVVLLSLAPAAFGQTAGEQLTGVVTPTIGISVDASGTVTGTAGTQPSAVTRELRGTTVVVTVTPAI